MGILMSATFDNLGNALLQAAGQENTRALLIGIVAVTLVVVGLAFILPVRRLNEFAKEHVLQIIIGAILVIGATALATTIANIVSI